VVETNEELKQLDEDKKPEKSHETQIKKLDYLITQILSVVDFNKVVGVHEARGRMNELLARSVSPGKYYHKYVASVTGAGLRSNKPPKVKQSAAQKNGAPQVQVVHQMDRKAVMHRRFPYSMANPAFLNIKVTGPQSFVNTTQQMDKTVITETNEAESV